MLDPAGFFIRFRCFMSLSFSFNLIFFCVCVSVVESFFKQFLLFEPRLVEMQRTQTPSLIRGHKESLKNEQTILQRIPIVGGSSTSKIPVVVSENLSGRNVKESHRSTLSVNPGSAFLAVIEIGLKLCELVGINLQIGTCWLGNYLKRVTLLSSISAERALQDGW